MSVEPVARNSPNGLDQKWKILISVMFGIFMIIQDSTVIDIAFPALRHEFGVSLADAQWVLSVYVLSLGMTTPLVVQAVSVATLATIFSSSIPAQIWVQQDKLQETRSSVPTPFGICETPRVPCKVQCQMGFKNRMFEIKSGDQTRSPLLIFPLPTLDRVLQTG